MWNNSLSKYPYKALGVAYCVLFPLLRHKLAQVETICGGSAALRGWGGGNVSKQWQ